MPRSYQQLLRSAYAIYENLVSLKVPRFDGEDVIFTHAGFAHLLRKRRRSRPIEDRIRRLRLVQHIAEVLLNPGANVRYRSTLLSAGKLLEYWELSVDVEDRRIAVVVSQIKPGPKTFLSIMD